MAPIQTLLLQFPLPQGGDLQAHALPIIQDKLGIQLRPLFSGEGIALLTGPCNLTLTLRGWVERGLATATLEYEEGSPLLLSYPQVVGLERALGKASRVTVTPPLMRGLDHETYFTTSDNRLLQYDIQEILFEEQTPWQLVQIGRSRNYGNCLILDGLVNISDSDLPYTEALMQRGKLSYGGKDVLILGGGDGALLYELRQETPPPKQITMVEIDDVVMRACKDHLRLACHSVLDTYKGDNYEILVQDCLSYMRALQGTQRRFDVIFGDLTDVPIPASPGEEEVWSFFRETLQLSLSLLREGGVFLTHGNGASSPEGLDTLEETMRTALAPLNLNIQRSAAFIPSFKEKWVFLRVERAE